jgi:hypothetical protein
MNAARVICSSLRHIFLNRGSAQIDVSFVLLSMIGILLRALDGRVFNGDAITLNCRELQLNDPRSARAARDVRAIPKDISTRKSDSKL